MNLTEEEKSFNDEVDKLEGFCKILNNKKKLHCTPFFDGIRILKKRGRSSVRYSIHFLTISYKEENKKKLFFVYDNNREELCITDSSERIIDFIVGCCERCKIKDFR